MYGAITLGTPRAKSPKVTELHPRHPLLSRAAMDLRLSQRARLLLTDWFSQLQSQPSIESLLQYQSKLKELDYELN